MTRPVNVLALGDLTFAEIAGAGAQRISVGGGLTWVGVSAFAERRPRHPRAGRLLVARDTRAASRLVRLGKAARRRAVGNDPAEDVSTVGDEAVERVGDASTEDAVSEERAVTARQAPARKPLVLWKGREQNRRRGVVERKDREALAEVEADDDTRRPAAEASARVVQEDGSLEGHRALSNPSSVARTSCPIVART